MKSKKIIIIIITILSIILLSVLLLAIDSAMVKSEKEPIFVFSRNTLEDGGTKVYYGLGYQIIKWNKYEFYSDGTSKRIKDDVEVHYIFGIKSF